MHVLIHSQELHFYHIPKLLAFFYLLNKLGVAMFPYLYVSFIILCYETCFNREKPTVLCAVLQVPFELPVQNTGQGSWISKWGSHRLDTEQGKWRACSLLNYKYATEKKCHVHFKRDKTKLDSRLYLSFYVKYSLEVSLLCKWKPLY